MHGDGVPGLAGDDLRRLDALAVDADLRAMVDGWGTLPEAVRAGMLAMVRAVGGVDAEG
jgi:hypothetical protein